MTAGAWHDVNMMYTFSGLYSSGHQFVAKMLQQMMSACVAILVWETAVPQENKRIFRQLAKSSWKCVKTKLVALDRDLSRK